MKTLQKGEGKNCSTLGTLLLPWGELQSSWYCNRAGLETSLSHPCLKSPGASSVSGISCTHVVLFAKAEPHDTLVAFRQLFWCSANYFLTYFLWVTKFPWAHTNPTDIWGWSEKKERKKKKIPQSSNRLEKQSYSQLSTTKNLLGVSNGITGPGSLVL